MRQAEFGYRIRQALDESTERLDYKTTYRLEQVRKAALARHNGAACAAPVRVSRLATAGGPSLDEDQHGWLWQAGWIAPMLALVIGFFGIYEYQSARRVSELADIDFAVLLDEAPIAAYADKGFGAYLKTPLPAVEAEARAAAQAQAAPSVTTDEPPPAAASQTDSRS